MAEFEFDVDASITAGWDRFAAHLAELVRALPPGGTFELPVPGPPLTDSAPPDSPCIRFTRRDARGVHAEVTDAASENSPVDLGPQRLEHLRSLGWGTGSHDPHVTVTDGRELEAAHLVSGTLERVFGIPHPVFLHDAVDPAPTGRAPTVTDSPAPAERPDGHEDFRPQAISCPDEATRAIGTALAQVYRRDVPADENDVYAVPAGCLLLFIRAHRSLPLIVFRSPLVSSIADPDSAAAEVATLNRDSLWCRYVFDGRTIYAESELVDRVFLPINFKIQLAEVASELVDVHTDLVRRVAGRRWRELRSDDDHPPAT